MVRVDCFFGFSIFMPLITCKSLISVVSCVLSQEVVCAMLDKSRLFSMVCRDWEDDRLHIHVIALWNCHHHT